MENESQQLDPEEKNNGGSPEVDWDSNESIAGSSNMHSLLDDLMDDESEHSDPLLQGSVLPEADCAPDQMNPSEPVAGPSRPSRFVTELTREQRTKRSLSMYDDSPSWEPSNKLLRTIELLDNLPGPSLQQELSHAPAPSSTDVQQQSDQPLEEPVAGPSSRPTHSVPQRSNPHLRGIYSQNMQPRGGSSLAADLMAFKGDSDGIICDLRNRLVTLRLRSVNMSALFNWQPSLHVGYSTGIREISANLDLLDESLRREEGCLPSEVVEHYQLVSESLCNFSSRWTVHHARSSGLLNDINYIRNEIEEYIAYVFQFQRAEVGMAEDAESILREIYTIRDSVIVSPVLVNSFREQLDAGTEGLNLCMTRLTAYIQDGIWTRTVRRRSASSPP